MFLYIFNRRPVKKVLSNPVYVIFAIGIFAVIFSFSLYALLTLPGSNGYACVHRAYLTTFNVIFSAILSLLIAIFTVGFTELTKQHKARHQAKLVSLSGIALVFGILTTFCTVCTISIAIPFLAGIFSLFTTFNIWFKIIAMLSLIYALYTLDGQLKGKCKVCRL